MTLLEKLMEKGVIYIECNRDYCGIASDGVEVQLGNVGQEDVINNYLETHPTPDTW